MNQKKSQVSESQAIRAGVKDAFNWQFPLLLILFVLVVFTAIKTVSQRHEARSQFVKLQTLEKERDKLAAQWSRLKLEQSTMLNQVRVERLASRDLNMQIPKPSEKRMIREKIIVSPSVYPVMTSPKNTTVALGE
jgi:cell division protein FtsL